MAFRDRTKYYKTLRTAHIQRTLNANANSYVRLEDDKAALLTEDLSIDGKTLSHTNEIWMDHIQDARKTIQQIKSTLKTLDRLMSQFFNVSFDDDDDIKRLSLITNASKSINDQCVIAKQHILKAKSVPIKTNIRTETIVRQNSIINLIRQLDDVSHQFKAKEKAFMARYKSMTSIPDIFSEPSTNLEVETPYRLVDLEEGILQEKEKQQEQERQQMFGLRAAKVDAMSKTITQREQEIVKLAKSVEEVSHLFQDLHMLAQEQGTIIDQIDANIESTAINVEKGVVEIKEANQIQQKTRPKLCCLLLVVVVLILVITIIAIVMTR